jgi:TusE/DsrC/DsvC family sulfur relay protein
MPKKRKALKARKQKAVRRAKRKTAKTAKAKSSPIKSARRKSTRAKTASKTTRARVARSKSARVRKPAVAPRAGISSTQQAVTPPTPRTIFDILHPGAAAGSDPNFRDAPDGWTPAHAETLAAATKLALTEDHWEAIRVLQGCYKDEVLPRIRLLRDALEARFANRGGMKHLFAIFPGGPIAQGCVLAGLKPPHGARDLSFGSVA